jgi:hypothetical protein
LGEWATTKAGPVVAFASALLLTAKTNSAHRCAPTLRHFPKKSIRDAEYNRSDAEYNAYVADYNPFANLYNRSDAQ